MKPEEVKQILKGLHLTNKDAVTDYAELHFSYRALSNNLREIVNRRGGGNSWSPRTTWLVEYREALAMLIKDATTSTTRATRESE